MSQHSLVVTETPCYSTMISIINRIKLFYIELSERIFLIIKFEKTLSQIFYNSQT